jgi:hypothetical protein
MSGVDVLGAEIGSQEALFLTDGGVHHDVTTMFLRANATERIILVSTVDIFRCAADNYEQTHGESPYRGVPGSIQARASYEALETFPVFAEANEGPFIRFREGLAAHNSIELDHIEAELTAIMSGEITLSDSQKQQLSNLSDGDLQSYLCALGALREKNLSFLYWTLELAYKLCLPKMY